MFRRDFFGFPLLALFPFFDNKKSIEETKETLILNKDQSVEHYTTFDGIHKLHRLDGPALEFKNGDKYWFKEGKLHREDGPAVECASGDKFWHKEGLRHRVDGPAVESRDGTKEWYKDGLLHRLDGPAIEYANGGKKWYKEGKFHRVGFANFDLI